VAIPLAELEPGAAEALQDAVEKLFAVDERPQARCVWSFWGRSRPGKDWRFPSKLPNYGAKKLKRIVPRATHHSHSVYRSGAGTEERLAT
jgi:hypothetical protein